MGNPGYPARPAMGAAALALITGLTLLILGVSVSHERNQPGIPSRTTNVPAAARRPTPSPGRPSPTTGITPASPVDPARVFAHLPPPIEEKSISVSPGSELRLAGGLYRVDVDGGPLVQVAGPDDPANGAHFAFSVRSLSADGRWLAFALRPPLNMPAPAQAIFVKDLTSSEPARPVAAFGRVNNVAISPDGHRLIVYGSVDPPQDPGLVSGEMYLIDIEASTISSLPDLADSYIVAWSPTGEHVLFQSSRDSVLRIADRTGDIVSDLGQSGGAVAWSPDGSLLAVAQMSGRDGIHLVGLDGEARFLTEARPHDGGYMPSGLTWSPDGDRLAFHAHDSSLGGFAITIVDTQTGRAEVFGRGEAPVWSRDGKRLAYTRDGELFVTDPDGGQSVQLVHPAQPLIESPRWVSDSSAVLFHYAPWFLSSIRVMRPDGTGIIQLAYGSGPVWSPDGSQIAFEGRALSAGLAGQTEVWVMNADGSSPHKVGQYGWTDVAAGCGRGLSWSADGTHVLFDSISSAAGNRFAAPADGSGPAVEIEESCGAGLSPAGDASIREEVSNGFGTAVAVYDAIGTEVLKFSGRGARWSPDGSRIAYWASNGIHIAQYPSGVSAPLVDLGAISLDWNGGSDLLWSPDGAWVAYMLGSRYDNRTLWVVSAADGLGPFLVGDGGNAAWSPDSRRVAFTDGERSYDQAIYLSDVNRPGERVRVADGSAPSWSPDGDLASSHARSGKGPRPLSAKR